MSESQVVISQKGEQIFITATNTKSFEHFSILVNSPGKVVTEGKYALNSDRYYIGRYRNPDTGDFITGNGYEGEIEITKIDKVNLRISGKFYFNAYSEKTKQSVAVTEGNFNLRYFVY